MARLDVLDIPALAARGKGKRHQHKPLPHSDASGWMQQLRQMLVHEPQSQQRLQRGRGLLHGLLCTVRQELQDAGPNGRFERDNRGRSWGHSVALRAAFIARCCVCRVECWTAGIVLQRERHRRGSVRGHGEPQTHEKHRDGFEPGVAAKPAHKMTQFNCSKRCKSQIERFQMQRSSFRYSNLRLIPKVGANEFERS